MPGSSPGMAELGAGATWIASSLGLLAVTVWRQPCSPDGASGRQLHAQDFDADFADALVQGKVDVLRAVKLPTPAVAKLITDFAKNKVDLHFNAIVIDDKGDPLPNKEITLQWDKGTEKFKSDSQGVVRWPLALAKAKKLAMQLPTAPAPCSR